MSNPEPRDGYTALGLVLRPVGLRGEVRVLAFAPGAPNLQPGRRVTIGSGEFEILALRPDKEAWILGLDGVRTREAAEGLRDLLVEAQDSEIERDDADSYFVHELVGLRVRTLEGADVGTLKDVIPAGGADVYVVEAGDGSEILIPATGEVVASVDVAGGVMLITPLPGLLDNSQ